MKTLEGLEDVGDKLDEPEEELGEELKDEVEEASKIPDTLGGTAPPPASAQARPEHSL